MIVKHTIVFDRWFGKLDFTIKSIIAAYIDRLSKGIFTNAASVGEGVHELRIFVQKGYRIYFTNINGEVIILLCAGTKGGNQKQQQTDIAKAKEIKRQIIGGLK
jgi:putative addiction module killer protein